MAFLGDIGKFFGLGSSEEVLGDVGATIGGFVGDVPGALVGRRLGSQFGRATSSLAGSTADQPFEQSALPARETNDRGSQESMFSGSRGQVTSQGFIGGLSPLINVGRNLLRNPGVNIGVGTGVGALGSNVSFSPTMGKKPLVFSNANKSRIRKMLMDFGLDVTIQNLNRENAMKGRPPVTINDIVELLSTTIRKQGYPITFAALRKTRKTLNRLKSMKMLYDDMSRTTTRRRRTTGMKRASTITQIRN